MYNTRRTVVVFLVRSAGHLCRARRKFHANLPVMKSRRKIYGKFRIIEWFELSRGSSRVQGKKDKKTNRITESYCPINNNDSVPKCSVSLQRDLRATNGRLHTSDYTESWNYRKFE